MPTQVTPPYGRRSTGLTDSDNGIALSGAPLTGSVEDRVEVARASVVYIVTE